MRRAWALLLLLVAACGTGDARPTALRVVATPLPTGHASVDVHLPKPTPTPEASGTGSRKPATASVQAPGAKLGAVPAPAVPAAGLASFRGLGSWIDVFDHENDPASITPLVDRMHKLGTKTLYLETARYASTTDIQFPKAVGAALDSAKAHGMRVVAWYPPDFKDMKRDIKRSVAAVRFRSPNGNRFDAFGADIEYTAGVPDHEKRNKLAVEYSKQLRKHAGPAYPLAAIVIPPTWLEINPARWPDFPWATLSATYDLFMPMNYWTARGKDTKTAYDLTKADADETKRLTGKPVHIIGGLGEDADKQQTAAYVKAARDAGSLGGGLYDFTTTRDDVWGELRKLN